MMAFAPCVVVAGIVLLTTAAAMGTSAEMSYAAGSTAVVSGLTIMPVLVLMRHKAKRHAGTVTQGPMTIGIKPPDIHHCT
nr:unnamed protein product [Spirometra erinaceieuropaei]